MIHADAIKCRFCREFLEDDDGLPVSHHARRGPRRAGVDEETTSRTNRKDDDSFFIIRPSLWGLLGFFFTLALFMAIAVFLLSSFADKLIGQLAPEHIVEQIGQYVDYAGLALGALTLLIVLVRMAQLKSIHYEVGPDRIEYARGIFSRKIDNLDMFRVIDLKLHRSLLDCLTGVGTVTLVTKDETDPFFDFEKVADPKKLYDVLKKASLEADRKQGVLHLD